MNLPEFSVKNPYKVLMIFLAVLMISVFAIFKLPIDLMPDIEVPAVSVIVPYPGASASDVESDVTKYLEDQLITTPDLDELISVSKDNISVVTCKFKWGKNLDVATNDVRDKVDFAKKDIDEHAPDAEEPMIFKFSTSMAPVVVISVSSNSLWRDLHYIVDKKISDPLKKVEGVGTVMVFGGLKRQIKVILDWEKIHGYGVPVSLIISRLSEENIDFPLGDIKTGRREYFLRVKGRYKTIEEIKDTVIYTTEQGKVIYLKDIADILDSYQEQTSKSYINGVNSILLIVQKQSGANTVFVAKNVKRQLGEIKKTLPPEVKVEIAMDTSDMIIKSIKNLVNTVITAFIIVVFVVVFLLRRLNLAFIVSVSIPFSLICAFLLLYLKGYTINMISLMSLAITIGMVVDNSIVILENITRHFEGGEEIEKATILGAGEVGRAVAASTITTIVVFLPLMFMTGLVGIIFKQLGYLISGTIFVSLIVALSLVPMLSSKLIKHHHRETKFFTLGETFLKKFDIVYTKILKWALSRKYFFLTTIFVIFVVSLSFFRFVGSEFFPEEDTARIEANFLLNPNTRLEETDKIVKKIGKIFEEEIPERKLWYGRCGQTEEGFGTIMGMEEGPNAGSVAARLVWREERKRSDKEIAQVIRKKISQIPGIEKFFMSTANPMETMFMGGARQIEVELYGPDLEKLVRYAEELENRVKEIPGAVDVDTSYKKERLEIHISVDREKAKVLGVSTSSIAQTIRTYIYGYEATKFRQGGEDFDIFVQLKENQRYDFEKLKDLPIYTSNGKIIKLKDVASINLNLGPVQIDRKNRERIVKVRCNTYKRAMSEVLTDIKKEVKGLNIPPDIIVKYAGMVKEQKESFRDLSVLLVFSIVFVYMVMVGQFESLKTPFIIFFSIPFTFIGVVWALLLTGIHFSMASFMALIMLIGVVVNNAIVLVDYINILRERGYSLYEAIITGARTRLRPIMITSLTTIFGFIPMALGRGTGGEVWQAFGVVLIGGFLLSWVVTLVLVPVIYLVMNSPRKEKS